MSETEVKFTPEQEAAIKYRGGALLVSAAAGSGKTKVLVERLLGYVEQGSDIDEFLVITYTRAAAAELRGKIYEEMTSRLAVNPENKHLRRVSMLCGGASIDTIHGFCADILRENAHLARLSADFRVADDSESETIRAEVLDTVLSEAYETAEMSDDFRDMIDMISTGRDDKRLVMIILDTHAKLRSNPDPDAWVEEQAERLSLANVADVSETIWGALLLDKTRAHARHWLGVMSSAKNAMKASPDFDLAYGPNFDAVISDIQALVDSMENGWDEARKHCNIDFSRVKPKRIQGFDDLKETRLRCKTAMKKLAPTFECCSKDHIDDMRSIAPATVALLQFVLKFDRAYSKEKRSRGIVDFADLEHLTLSLLINRKTGEKTGIAGTISQRFKEIMVDEYQDVNAIQESIFNAISQDSRNVFMVGDVKQSIYRFRLADPSIFLDKYKRFTPQKMGMLDCDSCQENGGMATDYLAPITQAAQPMGTKILLSKNFRSKAGILETVNFIFREIMSVEFGEMNYTKDEYLIPGREDASIIPRTIEQKLGSAVEFDIVDMSETQQEEDEESPAKTQVEAKMIADRVAELVDGQFMIPDGQGNSRPVKYSDIVILLRSIRDKAKKYCSALMELGIPVDMPGSEGVLESAEVSAALSLMSVIDNPMQDIPLVAALRGPIYRFTDDELAEIRAGTRGADFYRALMKAAETNGKSKAFLMDIDAFREVMPDMPADRFIWHMYNKTRLLELVGAMRGGERRRGNLILLAERAREFEQSGYKGLFGFLTYIRSLKERGADIAKGSAEPLSGAAVTDAVRIMSIHKSKGLEFPIVILADTTKRLNNKDARQPLVLHPALGVGTTMIDRQRRAEYTTLARMAIQSKLTSEMMAEELRLLYVAMTRAREKLIITAAYRDADKEIEKLIKLSSGGISAQALEETKNMAGWILMPALHERYTSDDDKASADDIMYSADDIISSNSETCEVLDIRRVAASESDAMSELEYLRLRNTMTPGDAITEEDEQEAAESRYEENEFIYPHEKAPDLPSKLTVTGLKGRYFDQEAKQWFPEVPSGRELAYTRPTFVTKRTGLTAAERGTALHLALQYVDFSMCQSVDDVSGELRRLVEKGFLTKEKAAEIDATKITRFFESRIGQRAVRAENIKKEFKFSLLYPAERFFPGGGEDKILFQGVIDCFFEEDGELVVIDFKTDRVTKDTLMEKSDFYAPQLMLYSEALERITGKRVKESIIYYLDIGEYVSV
ncbi:MAG: UvrD-helicase domain-containing protein [Oscillospiraceae bacterium]|nr:UvrD-helicase domain-containing protein [Oscillospiraceae bacterium]